MHFRFHFDRDGFHKEFSGRFGSRGRRWAAFAQRFADEFGWGGEGAAWLPFSALPRRRFCAQALKIVILHLLKDEPRHGYDLIKAIEEKSAGLYSPSPGMIYPMLSMLADEGLIAEVAGEEGRRRYAITDAGRAALDAAEEALKAALERLADMARCNRDDAKDDGRETMREAMHDLREAARDSVRDAEARAERAEAIAAILREALKLDARCLAGDKSASGGQGLRPCTHFRWNQLRGAAARVSRSLMARPSPCRGTGATAMPALPLACATCSRSNNRAAASVRSPLADRLASPATMPKPMWNSFAAAVTASSRTGCCGA
jgi:DNA-binding PadR family transcriptional regulator